MNISLQIDLSLYSTLIPLILIIYMKQNSNFEDGSTHLFIQILWISLIMSLADGAAWIPNGIGHPQARLMNSVLNTMYFALCTLPTMMWVRYFDYKIFNDLEGLRKRSRFYFITSVLGWILIISNFFTGAIFTISETNIYIRGPLNSIYLLINYLLLIIALLAAKKYWKLIKGRLLHIIMIFILFPILGSVLQQLFYGTSLTYPFLNITALLTFLFLEKEFIHRDSLTELFTRHQFERRLTYKLNHSEPFSLIMIDLNDFKQINDNFGHEEGDKALVTFSSILKSNVKHEDMVCRYGGDEFTLLIESPHRSTGSLVIDRINDSLKEYNGKKISHYHIKMSFGYQYVDSKINLENLLSEVDKKMYKDKNLKKKRSE